MVAGVWLHRARSNTTRAAIQLKQHQRWISAQEQWLAAMRGELTGAPGTLFLKKKKYLILIFSIFKF